MITRQMMTDMINLLYHVQITTMHQCQRITLRLHNHIGRFPIVIIGIGGMQSTIIQSEIYLMCSHTTLMSLTIAGTRDNNSYNTIFDWNDLEGGNYADWSIAPIFYSLELEKGTGFSFLSYTLKHSYTDGSGDIQDSNILFGNNAEGEPVGHMWGGWDNLTLTFHLRPNVYTDSVYTFTMYYELYPVTVVD